MLGVFWILEVKEEERGYFKTTVFQKKRTNRKNLDRRDWRTVDGCNATAVKIPKKKKFTKGNFSRSLGILSSRLPYPATPDDVATEEEFLLIQTSTKQYPHYLTNSFYITDLIHSMAAQKINEAHEHIAKAEKWWGVKSPV